MKFLARLLNRHVRKEPESNVSRALRGVVEGDNPSTRRGLYDALKNQRLVLPVLRVPNNLERDAAGRLLGNMPLDFLSFQDRSGREFIAVFTHPDALNKWKADAPTWIAVDTPCLCRLALESGQSSLQINPGNHNFVELSLDEIRILAGTQAGG
jgi:hypothetical protein